MLQNSSENIYLTRFSLEYRESLLQNYAFVARCGFLFDRNWSNVLIIVILKNLLLITGILIVTIITLCKY